MDFILPEFRDVLAESYDLFKDNAIYHKMKKKEKK